MLLFCLAAAVFILIRTIDCDILFGSIILDRVKLYHVGTREVVALAMPRADRIKWRE